MKRGGLFLYFPRLDDAVAAGGVEIDGGFPIASHRPDDPIIIPADHRIVRHPLMLGFLTAFWATPHMTVGHLVFAGVCTAYILVAIQIEERDLIKILGDEYRQYRREVPMIIPIPKRK